MITNRGNIDKRTNRTIVKGLYEVSQVGQGFYYYLGLLLDIAVDIFKYEGLPESLPQSELEKRLITTGHVGVIQHPKQGLICSDSTLYDRDFYGNYRALNFFNPHRDFFTAGFLPTAKEIGKECAIIYNNSIESWLDMPVLSTNNFFQTIQRYARMLAEVDSTTYSEMIQQRTPYMPVAGNQQSLESVKALLSAVKSGETDVILDEDFLKELKSLKIKDSDPAQLSQLIETKNSILKYFLMEIGIYSTDDKKERLIVDEVATENKNVKVFIHSMLKSRRKGVDMINELYGTSISVALNDEIYNSEKLYNEPEEEEVEEVEEVVDEETKESEEA